MSCLLLTAAPFNSNNENNSKKSVPQRKQTYKNKENVPKKIKKEQIEHIYNESDDDSGLADFTSESNNSGPVQTYLQSQYQKNDYSSGVSNLATTNINENIKQPSNNTEDSPVSQEAFTQLESNYSKDYYKQYRYPGSYVAPQSSIDSQAELLKKLDNILYLLEEQQEDKTNLITEELILYVFLGVFVIYVLDSFVKVGKYVR